MLPEDIDNMTWSLPQKDISNNMQTDIHQTKEKNAKTVEGLSWQGSTLIIACPDFGTLHPTLGIPVLIPDLILQI